MTRYALTRDTVHAWDGAVFQLEDGAGGAGEFRSALERLADAGGSIADESPSCEELLGAEWDPLARPLLIAGLLRLVVARADLLEPKEIRLPVFKALSSWAPDAVFRAAKVKRSEQTYKVEAAIQHSVADTLHRVSEVTGSPVTAEGLRPFRTAVMKAIRAPMAAAVIEPFVPLKAVTTRLDAVFTACEGFFGSTGSEAVGTHERAVAELESYKTELEAWGTRYAIEYLLGLANGLLAAVDDQFSSSSASKPADLRVRGSEKRYPLGDPDRRFDAVAIIRNEGEGRAEETSIRIFDTTGNVVARSPEVYMGRIDRRETYVHMPCEVITPDNVGILSGQVCWVNVDGSPGQRDFELSLTAQRADMDFEALEGEEPYSLEPVTTEEELVGRTEQLSQLMALARGKRVGSCILWGQKRVGKTSLAQTLARRIRTEHPEMIVAYVEGGDYVDPNPKNTISNLGRRLAAEVRDADERLHHLEIPPFDGALTPLAEFLRIAAMLVPEARVLFILDEFDELPIDLYKRGDLGDAFFLTLRTISGKGGFGFVLVGGEKMEQILSSQGDALNKFKPIRVDYFDKETHWADFAELVRRPVADWLDVTDSALGGLYDTTAGNPFFTKLICGELFKSMVQKKDSHVTEDEVREAVQTTLRSIASNSFQHFWEDGILDVGPAVEEISVRRRKILLGLARVLRAGAEPSGRAIARECESLGVSAADVATELSEFTRRQVLVLRGPNYRGKVPFFEAWLVDYGVSELLTAFLAWDEIEAIRERERSLFVRSEELVDLVSSWGNYRGMRVTEERVRAWLEQFPSEADRRLMFRLLQGIRFYPHDLIRQKLAEAHGIVRRGVSQAFEEGRRKRGEFVVSYLDSVGKSGASYARLYVEENGVYFENILEKGKLGDIKQRYPSAQALVFVDDFVGTGDTVSGALKELTELHPLLFDASTLSTYVVTVTAFTDGLARIERTLRQLRLQIQVRACDVLSASDRCFDEASDVFPDPADRGRAREIAESYGRSLVRNAPLGYGGGSALVVFEQSIPNNCPPILWKTSGSWTPLFPRD